ncbi:unnamed protein product [Penicillium egyptiacum]|uniref:Uncharacterized protein n=1 Tax=Penicillium egyptiacum TaxID=1303716 RepID=A0A9W4KN46_9EURO|nr:unnamed protein product [Penicillium egyptiacum]
MDIIWSSLLTVFLCTWTAVCLNIPNPKDSQFHIFYRRAKWVFWAIVSPGLVLSVAIGQYASAWRSVKHFRKLRIKEDRWSLRHGFYADMGGMLLQPKDSTRFLVNSRQLAYLVEKQYLECPQIMQSEIWDKSKTDTLARVLSFFRPLRSNYLRVLLWFVPLEPLFAGRAHQVMCTGIVLSMEVSTAEVLLAAGDVAATPYRHTPLDFVAKQSFTCSYDVMGFFGLRFDDRERPL